MQDVTPKSGLKSPWWVVFGSTAGLIPSNGPIVLFTYTILLAPITREFGWDQADVGFGILFAHVSAALMTPVVGRLIDRWGIRRIGMLFITGFALSIAAIGLTPASPLVFVLLYTIAGVFSAGQTVMPYAKAVSACFDAKRGIALGVAMAGVGLGTYLVPQYTRWLVQNIGWREAYFGMGAAVLVLALPAMAFFVGQADSRLTAHHKHEQERARDLPGIDVGEAVRDHRFYIIAAAGFLVACAVNGAIPHVVPILTARGMPVAVAAAVMGAAGLSTICGRLVSGYLLDRVFAPYVALAFFGLPVAGIAILASGMTGLGPLLAVICLGLGLGAEIDMMGFMASRYFGLKRYGEIYGYIFAMFAFGSGFGPALWDVAHDATQSYAIALGASAAVLVIAGLLLLALGPYAFPAPRDEDREEALATA